MNHLQTYKLFEYYSQDISALKRYLNMSDEEKARDLAYQFPHLIADYIESTGDDIATPHDTEDPYELIDLLTAEEQERFGEWLLGKIENDPSVMPQDIPSWSYLEYQEDVHNQWLIHFSNDAGSIALDGFRFGVDQIDKLGLTTYMSEFDKKYGGYNFAYLLKDFHRYGGTAWSDKYKYGSECVIFRASGVKAWHNGDQEPQVIFYGKTATNINHVQYEEDGWYIEGRNGRKLVQFDSLVDFVDWFVRNYAQYRRQLA